jgi:hypothetical protein
MENLMRLRLAAAFLLLAPNAPAGESLLRDAMAAARTAAAGAGSAQDEIAGRDHDERLKAALAALTRRSCEAPGSVAQAELDGLAKPYAGDFAATGVPAEAGDCAHVYLYLAGGGRDEKTLRWLSTPPQASPAVPDAAPAAGVDTVPFAQLLPKVREFAALACAAPDRARLDPELLRPRENILFLASDDRLAARLESGLGICGRPMFHRIIGVIRHGNPRAVNGKWLKERVDEYVPRPAA